MTRDRGAALLLAVLLVSLLAVLVVEFQREARMELRTAANLRDTVQAHALARSGAMLGSAILLADLEENNYDYRGDTWTLLNDFPFPIGLAVVEVNIEDLDGKFPLGSLINARGQLVPSRVDAYQRLLEAIATHMKEQPELADADLLDQVDIPALVEALVDWIDSDTEGGYERYEEFAPSNSPLASLEELYRIEGYNVVPQGYGHAVVEALLPYVDTRGEEEINVNTAEAPVLMAAHPDMDYSAATQLVEEIDETPAEQSFNPATYDSVRQLNRTGFVFKTGVKSSRFRVQLSLDVGGVNHTAEALVERNGEEKNVETLEWREGWMRRRWRHRIPVPAAIPEGFSL